MKKLNILLTLALAFMFASCEMDNYDEPNAGIKGQITDNTGKPFQVAKGQGSMSIRIVEESFANGNPDVTVTPQNLNMMQDGGYVNNKLFAGEYSVIPFQGAFYENVEAKKVTLSNGKVATVDFQVTPYLSLEWVKKPYLDSDNYLRASFKFTRNHVDGMDSPDPNQCCMWISRVMTCGPEGDGNYTPGLKDLTPEMEGEEIELVSKIPIKYSMKYWVRIGANSKDPYKKYNFTDIVEIDVKLN